MRRSWPSPIAAVVTNAIEAVGRDGHVHVVAREWTEGDARSAEVIVRDDGPGISEAVRRHLFDPFFSGREAGRGLGFGLSKCWRIVTDHGGQVVVNNRRGRRGGVHDHAAAAVGRYAATMPCEIRCQQC